MLVVLPVSSAQRVEITAVLHVFCAAWGFGLLSFWSSVRKHSYVKGAAAVFTGGCPSVVPAGLREDPFL